MKEISISLAKRFFLKWCQCKTNMERDKYLCETVPRRIPTLVLRLTLGFAREWRDYLQPLCAQCCPSTFPSITLVILQPATLLYSASVLSSLKRISRIKFCICASLICHQWLNSKSVLTKEDSWIGNKFTEITCRK